MEMTVLGRKSLNLVTVDFSAVGRNSVLARERKQDRIRNIFIKTDSVLCFLIKIIFSFLCCMYNKLTWIFVAFLFVCINKGLFYI